jgi:hypothetical protein
VIGPYYANFRAITDDLLAHKGVRIAAKEELAGVLIELLRDRTEAVAMGERARQVFNQQAGATGRCLDAMRELLTPGSSEERPVMRNHFRPASCCCRWFRLTGWRLRCASCGWAQSWSRCGGCAGRW